MSTPYALRYTLRDAEKDAEVLEWIKQKSPGHLVVLHAADDECNRDHWHALMWVDKKLDALRKDWSKSHPEAKGNAAYSLSDIRKKKDDDPVEAYERYMCHGAHEGDEVRVVSAVGVKYTPEWFVAQNKAYYGARREFKKQAAKSESKENLVNVLLKAVEEAGLRTREEIAKKLVDIYLRDRRPLNVFYCRTVVNTVWGIVGGQDARAELVAEIAGRM